MCNKLGKWLTKDMISENEQEKRMKTHPSNIIDMPLGGMLVLFGWFSIVCIGIWCMIIPHLALLSLKGWVLMVLMTILTVGTFILNVIRLMYIQEKE